MLEYGWISKHCVKRKKPNKKIALYKTLYVKLLEKQTIGQKAEQ